ncbi:hypothetical protein BDZ89DRAFT_1138528 [Hymenopellis radicata]|nr:hypothetical protein BDZ89DRAFT_1138528 [Hymenopellis radicata]
MTDTAPPTPTPSKSGTEDEPAAHTEFRCDRISKIWRHSIVGLLEALTRCWHFDVDSAGTPSGQYATSPGALSTFRKRKAQDLTQYALSAGRAVRLKTENQDTLSKFAQLDPDEQLIWLAARTLSTQEALNIIHPPAAPFVMPETINERIDSEAWLIFVEPNLPAYVDDKAGPNSILLVKSHNKTVTSAVGRKFTTLRNQAKGLLETSMGTGILDPQTNRYPDSLDNLTLCRRILEISGGGGGKNKKKRQIYMEKMNKKLKVDNKYWGYLDAALDTIRTAKDKDPIRISRVIQNILEKDRAVFGTVEETGIAAFSNLALAGTYWDIEGFLEA